MSPFLGRCKSCDFALFLGDDQGAIEVRGWGEMTKLGVVYCMNGTYFSRCPSRHKSFVLNRIEGTYSKDHKCDSRCLNARGHKCRCSCGGANHGRGYAVTAHVASEALEEPTERFLGEKGRYIKGLARVIYRRDLDTSILYKLKTLDDTAKITWFCRDADPEFEVGQTIYFRAEVKRHEEHPQYGKTTTIDNLEEINKGDDSDEKVGSSTQNAVA
jgi:hypothetical protein